MKYVDDFLEYLKVVKKHSENTIINYQVDILEFKDYVKDKILDIDKETVNGYLNYLYDLILYVLYIFCYMFCIYLDFVWLNIS